MTSEIEAYHPKFDWELKRSDLSSTQKRLVKGWKMGHGEKNCFFCKEPLNPRLLYNSYTVHHEIKIGLPFCNLLPNLHLAHFSCNSRAGPAKAIQKQRERNKTPEQMNPTEQLREVVNYAEGSTEMQANNLCEVEFGKWVKRHIGSEGQIEYRACLNLGAYKMGCGQQAIRRYLDKLIAGKELACHKDLNTKRKMLKLTAKGEENF